MVLKMADYDDMLKILREKVSKTRKRLEEEENAVLVVERMLSDHMGAPATPTTAKPSTQEISFLDTSPIEISTAPAIRSFIDEVRLLVPEFNGENITVVEMMDKLIANGIKVESKERVSMALSKMLKQNEIISVTKGVGRSPSVYKEKV